MIPLRSRLTRAVLNYFLLQDGKELYVNELARRLSLDSGNLTKKLVELEDAGILKSRWQGKERFYSLNTRYPLLKEYKSIFLKTIGLENMLSRALKSLPGIKKAVLFGSYAADRMDLHSDIDLLVIGRHSAIELQKVIALIQKQIDRDINIVDMTEDEYKRKKMKKDPLIISIESRKHILLV